jgi:hypothetical protein
VVYTVTLIDAEGKESEVKSTVTTPIVITLKEGNWRVKVKAVAVGGGWSSFAEEAPEFWGETENISVSGEEEKVTIDTSAMSPSIKVNGWGQLSKAFNGEWDKFLKDKIGWKPSGKPQKYYIEILDIASTDYATSSAILDGDSNKNVVLWADKGKGVTIKRSNTLTSPLFQIEKGTLTLGRDDLKKDEQGTITIDGDKDNNSNSNDSLITVFGTLVMHEGVTITNNKKTSSPFSNLNSSDPRYDGNIGGGGVYVVGGIFTMDGGTISHNNSANGGGVRVRGGGTFIMSGGEICDNEASNVGGGVRLSTSGTFTMSDEAKIYNNVANSNGGGVSTGNIFTMNGGEISGNGEKTSGNTTVTTQNSGGVYVDKHETINPGGGTFIMNRGEISGNTAINGTGVYVGSDGKFFPNGGTLSDSVFEE